MNFQITWPIIFMIFAAKIHHSKKNFKKLIIVTLLCIICVLMLKNEPITSPMLLKKTPHIDSFIPPNCSCSDKDGNTYNFCYINPMDSTMIGKRFDCKHLEAVKELGLLNMEYIDLSRDEMPDPQFVTAISENHIVEGRLQTPHIDSFIPPNCSCSDKDGNTYNFCYINPMDSTMIGKRFDCKHLEAVKELGLLNMEYIDLSRDEMPDPQFVTAISENHIVEGRLQLMNFHDLWPNKKIVVFDMGLGKFRKEYENDTLVDLRDFPFDSYPEYMYKLFEYRWKPIVIAKMLEEFGAIFYMDTSIRFNDPDLSPIYNLFRCKNKNNRPLRNVTYPKYAKHSNLDALLKSCKKSSYLFHTYAIQSTFAATHSGMYDYLPIARDLTTKYVMRAAGLVTVVRTKEVMENIVKWSVLCALEQNCMGPPGARLNCKFKNDRKKVFADCHRYDQSVVNILSANLFNGNINIYRSGLNGYFSIDRKYVPKNSIH